MLHISHAGPRRFKAYKIVAKNAIGSTTHTVLLHRSKFEKTVFSWFAIKTFRGYSDWKDMKEKLCPNRRVMIDFLKQNCIGIENNIIFVSGHSSVGLDSWSVLFFIKLSFLCIFRNRAPALDEHIGTNINEYVHISCDGFSQRQW